MNKILAAGAVALVLTATVQQPVQAWSKYNIGVGFNLGWEGGGNSVLWGMYKGANTPGATDGDFGAHQHRGLLGRRMGYPGYPGYSGFPGYDFPVPNQMAEPPMAPADQPEKVVPPTAVKPASYNPYQMMGYYPNYPMYPTYPMYPMTSNYPAYPAQMPYPMYPAYPTYPGYYGQ